MMTFEEFRARKEAERLANRRVTWRRVSELTGGGWSGLGPDGLLVWITEDPSGMYRYGDYDVSQLNAETNVAPRRTCGLHATLNGAKRAAADLILNEKDPAEPGPSRHEPTSTPALEAARERSGSGDHS